MTVAPTTAHDWRSPMLGELAEVSLSAGRLQYFHRGQGPVIVFAHGWLANANLWRNVVDRLVASFTCVALDLPFGSHRVPMRPDADLSPAACGALLAEVLEALDLGPVTLVGNDSGGAYAQIAAARQPQRIGRLVLNSCETPYDEFPPAPFDQLPVVARDPVHLAAVLGTLRDRAVRASARAYGLLIKHPIADEVSDSYALPCLYEARILGDAAKVMSTAASRPVHEAGARLMAAFDRPVLFAWSPEDRVFPVEHARRYAASLARGTVALIEDAYSFTPEDQPERLAATIGAFARAD